MADLFLNYAKVLGQSAVGLVLGPDTQGRRLLTREVLPRIDGKPGSRLRLQRLAASEVD